MGVKQIANQVISAFSSLRNAEKHWFGCMRPAVWRPLTLWLFLPLS